MKRILVLYIDENDNQRFREGLLFIDKSVYVRGLGYDDNYFLSMDEMEKHLKNDSNVDMYKIFVLDSD